MTCAPKAWASSYRYGTLTAVSVKVKSKALKAIIKLNIGFCLAFIKLETDVVLENQTSLAAISLAEREQRGKLSATIFERTNQAERRMEAIILL